ncbi:hypothetical protein CP533_5080 [Ophiocordyceps camponoti-saundersi (nom. inval.)]|nr:hypothetical protein CP533_5080 [Ophiocordyceps camponoti-saundersi (nom. inval.)]
MLRLLLFMIFLSRVAGAVHYFALGGRSHAYAKVNEVPKDLKTLSPSRPHQSSVTRSRNLVPNRIVYYCNVNDNLDYKAAKIGMTYLYAKDGGHAECRGSRPTEPGVERCVRISCSFNTAIYWCLYPQASQDTIPCWEAARLAQGIFYHCGKDFPRFAETRILGGRAFTAEYDNAFVALASAKC